MCRNTENVMLISGIRQKLSQEFNSCRSAKVTKYLVHYLQMFAFLGIIFPVLIFTDCFFLEIKSNDERVIDKYYKLRDNLNHIEYFIVTDSYHFLSDDVFFEQINKDDDVKISRTHIFKSVTYVSFTKGCDVYNCIPSNIYGWPIFFVGLTFICSFISLIKINKWLKKSDFIKNDSVINFGIFNAIICLITIFAALFQVFD